MKLSFQLKFSLTLLIAIRIIPESQLFFKLLMLIVLNLVQLQISKFSKQLINILDLFCFLGISLQKPFINSLNILNSLYRLFLTHSYYLNINLPNLNFNQIQVSSNNQFMSIIILVNLLTSNPMQRKPQRQQIFMEIGKSLAQSKPKSRKQTYSFIQGAPAKKRNIPYTVAHVQQNPIQPKRKLTLPCTTKINKTSVLVSGLNDQFLYLRKQNHLNTCYNLRKNKLKEITKQNKIIHNRINSQKSLYSSTDLNKSFESNTQIKKRLSQSKLSKRMSSSRSSSRSGTHQQKNKRFALKKKGPDIQIKTSNINTAKGMDINSFKALFSGHFSSTHEQALKKQYEPSQLNSYRKESHLPKPIRPYGKTVQPIISQAPQSNPIPLGGILHRIAEVMFKGNDQKPPKKLNGYMRPKKSFNF